jgi:hypothetical protein
MIKLSFGLRKIVVAATIHDVDVFTCVSVIEPETVFPGMGRIRDNGRTIR